ncbi:MAG: hypothetical protein ACI8WB_006210, partial [Phenylobacterium sp.]
TLDTKTESSRYLYKNTENDGINHNNPGELASMVQFGHSLLS